MAYAGLLGVKTDYVKMGTEQGFVRGELWFVVSRFLAVLSFK